jgi:hypothetical protein
MPKFVPLATLAVLTALSAGCRTAVPADPGAGTPVSGRVATGTGVSFDFPAGWAEVPAGTSPFTKVFRNPSRQLEMRLAEASSGGLAITTHGDQMRRGLAVDGFVEQAGALTIEGRPAYRVIVRKKTPTGGLGIVVGTTILYREDRITTVYVSSTGDEKVDHRPEIDALLATLRFS